MSQNENYDFVIVGAGTAGCVLASRLSEDEDVRVLLLEAGNAEPLPSQAVPPVWPTLQQSPANWGVLSVEQAETGSRVPLSRGRGLGGSSAINGMVFTRGHRSGYDRWVAMGARGWGFDDMLPYFKRSENAVGRDPGLRGVGGPLTVQPADPIPAVTAALLDAALETGHRRATDITSGVEEGFGPVDLNIVEGKRQSAAEAYLRPVMNRPNLEVITDALVHRVRIEGGRCTGVDYSTAAGPASAGCSQEVVLTAGTFGTAQLLMLSGIGPQAHLREIGVEPLLNLPGVGANLQDHFLIPIIYRAAQPIAASANNHTEVIGLSRSDPAVKAPDVQTMFLDISYTPGITGPSYTILVSAIRPHSRGSLRLASAEPGAPPVVDPNYLSDTRDLDTIITALRGARDIGRATALDPWREVELQPGPEVEDDAGLAEYVRRSLSTFFHLVGTCRMGEDDTAVVGTDLRVHGIGGLRVADASVIPTIPCSNTNAAVYAIAERACDLIRS